MRARRSPRRGLRLLATVGVVGIVSTLGVAPAMAAPARTARLANNQVGFTGTTIDNPTGETVDLAGTVHLRTLVAGSDADGWTVVWVANVDHTTGTGETTGDRYAVQGIDAGAVRLPPGPPVRTASFEPSFTLRQPGSRFHPPSPCRLLVSVSFDGAGRIMSVDAHAGPSVPGGPID